VCRCTICRTRSNRGTRCLTGARARQAALHHNSIMTALLSPLGAQHGVTLRMGKKRISVTDFIHVTEKNAFQSPHFSSVSYESVMIDNHGRRAGKAPHQQDQAFYNMTGRLERIHAQQGDAWHKNQQCVCHPTGQVLNAMIKRTLQAAVRRKQIPDRTGSDQQTAGTCFMWAVDVQHDRQVAGPTNRCAFCTYMVGAYD
jgi:hypothetical protein